MPFDSTTILFLGLAFTFAGLVKGVTGMGLPTVAMGLMGAFMPPVVAAALLVIPTLATNLWQFLAGPNARSLTIRLWPMLTGCAFGTIAGTSLLVAADPMWSGFGLGIILILYSVYAIASPSFNVRTRAERWLSPVMGVTTGAIAGSTGVSVMPAAPYLQSLGLSRDELVQSLGIFFTVSSLALAAGLALRGAFRVEHAGMSLVAIAPAMFGMWIGQRIRNKISPKMFKVSFLLLLALLGLDLATRPFR